MMEDEEIISFLITNYNFEKNRYELGKEEIKIFNKNEFTKFLESLPIQMYYKNGYEIFKDNYKYFQIEIYTEKLRFIKDGEATCSVSITRLPIQFIHYWTEKGKVPIDVIASMLFDKSDSIEIRDIFDNNYVLVEKKIKKKEEEGTNIMRYSRLFISVSIYVIYSFIIFMLLYVPIRFFATISPFSLAFWIWLLSLTPVNIYTILYKRKLSKESKKTQIKYSIPILDHYVATDFSKWVINIIFTYGTLLLVIPLLIMNLTNDDAEVLLVLCCLIFAGYVVNIIFIVIMYIASRETKDEILESLLKYMQQENLTWSEKQYYLYICVEFKKKKVFSTGYYSKIYTILTLLFSIIPQVF